MEIIMIIAIISFALYYFIPKLKQSTLDQGWSILVLPFDNYTGNDTLEYFTEKLY